MSCAFEFVSVAQCAFRKALQSIIFAVSIAVAVVLVAGVSPADAKPQQASSGKSKLVKQASGRMPFVGGKVTTNKRTAQSKGVRVASLGTDRYMTQPKPARSVASGGVVWQASSGCLAGALRGVIADVSRISAVRVTSTCRSKASNAAAGGAKHSHHLTGNAVDFRVTGGNVGAVHAMLKNNGSVGGLKHYGGGLFHVDTGARRTW